ncbi:MAG: flagellar basal body P-ring formation chaperone FlgA, partial [Phycisphaerae bacterium]
GFAHETERTLVELAVTSAPPAGGSRVIHMDMIRSVLAASGTNMAMVTLSGATQCAVTRPSHVVAASASTERSIVGHDNAQGGPTSAALSRPSTLRQAVIDYFNTELARYGGRADVVFDHTSQQVLDLSGPTYDFKVRRRNSSPLGLIQLEVDVVADGRTVQAVPLVVQVSMTRCVVVARRSVNQGATIHSSDVELTPLSFTRLDELGLDAAAQTIGQRAKRFISAGSVIDPAMLESVPLVTRGQFVKLMSVAGAVRVVTTAKALRDGLLGEVITVRSLDNKRVEFDGVVVGPGAVQIGFGTSAPLNTRVATRGTG